MSINSGFKILGIDHLGLAPKDAEQNKNFFKLLSLPLESSETVLEQMVDTTIFDSGSNQSLSKLEILKPTSDQSSIAKFLEKKGSGIHHLALRVDSVDHAIKFLLKNGVKLVTDTAQVGVHHTKVVFVHPRSTGGILIELVEHTR